VNLRKQIRGESGFTIIETMVASLIMAIAFLGLAGVHALSSRAQSLGNNQGVASFIANEQIELMRRSPFSGVVSTVDSTEVGGVTFTIVRIVTNSNFSRRVSVALVWGGRMGTRVLNQTSIVSQVTNP